MEMINEMNILVMSANEYSMTDDNKQLVEGCTVTYFFFGENGEALNPMVQAKGLIGYQRAKVSLPFEDRSKFTLVPAVYKGKFSMTVGGDGKPVVKLVDILGYVGEVNFSLKASDKEPAKSSTK